MASRWAWLSGVVAVAVAVLGACGGDERPAEGEGASASEQTAVPGVGERLATIEGFSGPEAVRYDPDQDVWFVSNFNGEGGERDGNGFISRVSAESGLVEALRFARGTEAFPLHAPRGMYITGDSLWVADIDGLHAFDRRSGEQLRFVDLSDRDPGFLNDVARGPDGALYVTDTGRSAVYRVAGDGVTTAVADPALGNPNGITWDESRGLLVVVPWDPGARIHTWQVGEAPVGFGPRTTPGRLDGIEPFEGSLLVASQTDSTILLVDGGTTRPIVKAPGRPADIGVDTRRRRVAVPYIALDRVDVWALPAGR